MLEMEQLYNQEEILVHLSEVLSFKDKEQNLKWIDQVQSWKGKMIDQEQL